MAETTIITVDRDTWTQIAGSDEEFLISMLDDGSVYIALTDADAEPIIDRGHLLRRPNNEAGMRFTFGAGYAWAKSGSKDGHTLALTK